MSDLIDLNISSENLPRSVLAAPLLPCPNDAGDAPRPSLGPNDNPFDRLTQEVDRYVRLSNDPFEILPDTVSKPSNITKNRLVRQSHSLDRVEIVQEHKANLNSRISLEGNIDVTIVVNPPSPQDISILNESAMNDELLSDDIIAKGPMMSGNILSTFSPRNIGRNGSFLNNCTYNSGSSSGSDILNKAFVLKDLSISGNKILNGSGTDNGLGKLNVSDLVQKYQEIRKKSDGSFSREEGNLIEIEDIARDDDTFISGNFGKGIINKCLENYDIDFIMKETTNVLERLQSFNENFQDQYDELITSTSPPNFDDLPLSDDENLIDLPVSPCKNQRVSNEKDLAGHTNKDVKGKKTKEDIVKEMESELFSLQDPTKRCVALNLLVDLKNLVKESKPDAAKLLDDLENSLGLNCNDNIDLLTTLLPVTNDPRKNNKVEDSSEKNNNKREQLEIIDIDLNNLSSNKAINKSGKSDHLRNEKTKNIIEKERQEEEEKPSDKSADAKTVLSNLEKLLQESVVDSSTRHLLKDLGLILSKLSVPSSPNSQKNVEKLKQRSRSEMRRSNLLSSSRRSFTPDRKSAAMNDTILRRSNSVLNSSQVSKIHTLGLKSKSNLKSTIADNKKRCSSDSSIDSIKNDLILMNTGKQGAIPKISIPKTKLVTNIKSKLKRKTEVEPVSKKGPLKAVIPVNNMQKDEVSVPKKTLSPARSMSNLLNVSSTNPVATSTPMVKRSISHLKTRGWNNSGKNDSMTKLRTDNIKSGDENLKPRNSTRLSGLRMPSPIRYPTSPRRHVPKFSKLTQPKFSPQMQQLRNSLAKSQSNPNLSAVGKSFIQKPVIMSPLRTNNQNLNVKPSFSIPKINRNIGIDQLAEKENQYL